MAEKQYNVCTCGKLITPDRVRCWECEQREWLREALEIEQEIKGEHRCPEDKR